MDKQKVKDQMIKDLKWELEYHAKKMHEAHDRLRVLGVSPLELYAIKNPKQLDDESKS